ncbi:hypothetical protein L228DRAFT_15135 [Xylona heveae TC161]|uniref:Uncharacterized protein n=1 Tax=Xylona heveae (strain CBS 132557 / TC161) TaxID=1328760 RepID=A0A165JSP3_XYLHT|nr:hypothetical protein L228DRAFT_15135 [Xylona heveae TC161]KZF26575.1 hypothetical protein L228DRAFT_15135 [Xylona heveae TC161]
MGVVGKQAESGKAASLRSNGTGQKVNRNRISVRDLGGKPSHAQRTDRDQGFSTRTKRSPRRPIPVTSSCPTRREVTTTPKTRYTKHSSPQENNTVRK